MPLYEYVCLDCLQTFDTLRKIGQADEPIRCLACGSENTTRKLSLIAAPTRATGSGALAGPASGCGCGAGGCGCG
ncbi:MAG: zinc ribbon domain-containing protein [Ardenticatenaceae bacterium]|nr:zinc ribbon domain-containing protein [Ardenticatenaceae bacterium]HBY98695.1 zinc ribbon domain-containing protein [Chloroflexota bacterium]